MPGVASGIVDHCRPASPPARSTSRYEEHEENLAMAQPAGSAPSPSTPSSTPGAMGLPRRRLGRTQMVVSELSLGGVGIGGLYGEITDEDAAGAVFVRR